DSLGITVADKSVLAPVVVEVGEQSAPAPISVRDASQSSDLTENDVTIFGKAVAQLKRVLRVVDAIAVAAAVEHAAIGREPTHPLSAARIARHHVHLQHIWPAVVVEVGNIDTHSSVTGMLHPLAGFVRKCAIPVIYVNDVVGHEII